MLTTDIGNNYEQVAINFLKQLGYKIIDHNYKQLPIGEIDIIAKDGKTLVFVEVKYRKNNLFGNPSQFVNKSKQIKITKTALIYIKKNQIKSDIRFDVVSICGNNIEHIQNAFCIDKYYY